MATNGYLDSIKITGGDSAEGTRKTRYLRFSWSVTGTEIGKTTIAWELKGYGGNNAYTDYGIQLNGEWVVPKTYNATVSYKEAVITSGTKTYTHNSSGAATVSVSIWVGQIWEVSEGTTSDSWALETNYPYTNCGAPDPGSITISPAIQKPGGKITISWDTGSEGTANAVASYKVQYKIGSGSWSSAYSTSTTSKDITLPTNAARGYAITARVMSIGAVSGYDSDYSSAGGSGRVNNLPGTPTVSVDKTLVPSNGATVNFTLTAGGVGTGDTGQSPSLYYATSSTGTKTACPNSFSPTVGTTTTYFFWTYDGLEYSASYVSKNIAVNTKPTVTLEINEETQIANFPKDDNGQADNNTYTFGFTYKNQDYTLSSNQTGTSYSIGDMRKQLSDKLGSLIDNTTYSYNFWVYRNDGIESSEKVTTDVYSLLIPHFTLTNEYDEEAPFSRQVKIVLSDETGYSTIAFSGATTNGLSLDTTGLAWGTKIDKLLVNNSFYVVPQATLHKVYEIDIVPSGGKISPFSLSTFKTYTTQQLGISLAGRTTTAYGLTDAPNLILKYTNVYTNELVGLSLENESNDINTYIYYAEGKDIFNGINTGSSSVELTFELKNKFNDSFTRTFTLQLDHTEPAIPYTNINLYPGAISSTSTTKYPALNQWEYLKQDMPIYTDFSVLAFDAPTFIFEIYNYHNSGTWDAITSFSGEKDDDFSPIENYGETHFNTSPSHYYINKKELTKNTKEITQDHNVQFRMRIQTTGQETVYNFFNGASLLMKAHYGGRAYFTKVNFADSNLETEWVIEDYGYSSNGTITQLGLGIKEYTADIRKTTYPTAQEYVWNNFTGFENNAYTYEFLHIAPILYSTLSVSTTNGSYTNRFTTTKETDDNNFIYAVVYNIAPTVSYRKNYLGINAKDFSSFKSNPDVDGENTSGGVNDVVFVINAYNERQCVYFKGDGNLAKINVNDGTLHNFVIMGGSWDGSDEYITEQISYQSAEATSF